MVLSLAPVTARAEENDNYELSVERGCSECITVPLNAKVNLKVAGDAEGITYQWYKWETDAEGAEKAVSIEEATGSSYETEAITQYSRYYCVVTYAYGNM